MTNRVIDSSIVRRLYEFGAPDISQEGFQYVGDQDQGNNRWHNIRWLILKYLPHGTYWAVRFEVGLTEYQEGEYPWEESSLVTAFQVQPEQVTVTRYQKVAVLSA